MRHGGSLAGLDTVVTQEFLPQPGIDKRSSIPHKITLLTEVFHYIGGEHCDGRFEYREVHGYRSALLWVVLEVEAIQGLVPVSSSPCIPNRLKGAETSISIEAEILRQKKIKVNTELPWPVEHLWSQQSQTEHQIKINSFKIKKVVEKQSRLLYTEIYIKGGSLYTRMLSEFLIEK